MARKGRARRFREARQLKQSYDDGLFTEGSRTLADLEDADDEDDDRIAADVGTWSEYEDDEDDGDPLKIDQRQDSRAPSSLEHDERASTASESIS